MTESHGRGPAVVIPPPLFFVAGFLVGWLIDRYVWPLRPPVSPSLEPLVDTIAGFLVGVGLSVVVWGMATFHRAKTAIYPNRDASRLVIAGPYRWTRNPMYVGMSTAYIGFCLMFSAAWSLLALPMILAAVYRFVIAREERYLAAAFGDEYRNYQRDVGRWV